MTMATILAIILLEGFVTISVEILSIRQLQPFVGNNVIVTSLIIGVFLLFLAIGYKRGGEYRENYRDILKKNFSIAALLIGIGMSYTFTNLFFYALSTWLTQNILVRLTLYLLLIIAPIVYLLGQTVPITTNLFKRDEFVGAISGRVLYISTIGSFLGAVLTSLLLLNFLGVAWTVFLNTMVLGVLVYLLSDIRMSDLNRSVALGFSLIFIFFLNVEVDSTWFLKTNNYANYRVEQHVAIHPNHYGNAFVINNSMSSFLDDQKHAAPYNELLKQILFRELALKHKEILILGAGGFTFSAEGEFGNHVTYVDIDKDIKSVVEQHFLPTIHGEFIATDARLFLKKPPHRYDVIISDVYKSHLVIPSYLITREHLTNVRLALRAKGIAIFNIIADPLLNDAYSKRVDNTITSVFPSCMKMPMEYKNAYVNILYLCQKNSGERIAGVYTDDLNRSTLDFFNV